MITSVFVYGTLRPHGGMAAAWEPYAAATGDGYTTCPGGILMAHPSGYFPYLTLVDEVPEGAPTPKAVGALLLPHSETDEERLLIELDRIEGVPSHYERQLLYVHVVAGLALEGDEALGYAMRAWVYVASGLTVVMNEYDWQPVFNNDWYQHTQREMRR